MRYAPLIAQSQSGSIPIFQNFSEDRKPASRRIILSNRWILIIWRSRSQKNSLFVTVPWLSLLLFYRISGFFMYGSFSLFRLLYHPVFHTAFKVGSNIFLHQSDQTCTGLLRCPGDMRREIQTVVVRHL